MAKATIEGPDPLAELLDLIADARARADALGFGITAIHLNQAFERCEVEARKLRQQAEN